MSAIPKYIDSDDAEPRTGEVGFIIERSNAVKRTERWELSLRPAYTNQSQMPRLNGWCGTTNDVAIHAYGLARVVRTLANGRTEIAPVTGAEDVAKALDELGYPELLA